MPRSKTVIAGTGVGIRLGIQRIETIGSRRCIGGTGIPDFINHIGGTVIRNRIIIEAVGIITHGLITAIGTGEDGVNRKSCE